MDHRKQGILFVAVCALIGVILFTLNVATDKASESLASSSSTADAGNYAESETSMDEVGEEGGQSGDPQSEWKHDPALSSYPRLLAFLKKEADASVKIDPTDCVEGLACEATVEDQLEFSGTRLISVRSDFDRYTGGAHGIGGSTDTLWDRSTDRHIRFGDIFYSWKEARSLLQERFCSRLLLEYAEQTQDESEQAKIECPNVDDVAWTLVPSGGPRAAGFRASTSDYQLGSYAAGRANITLPVDDAIYSQIRPEFIIDFSQQ
ncbi:hypothetical protein [Allosphingosinicella humi]